MSAVRPDFPANTALRRSSLRLQPALFAIALAAATSVSGAAAPKEDLAVLTRFPRYQAAQHAIYNYLADQAIARLAAREAGVAKLATAADWRERQRAVRRALMEEILGPFPERTLLNARVTGIARQPGYRIEKVIYESVPGFHVTAALFVPDAARAPAATILFASGHTADAFRNTAESSSYLQIILNLVHKGFVVFAFDPISQGERAQHFDPNKGVSRLGKASAQHGYMGLPAQLTAHTLARGMTWDGVRAIDYLATRPEVDVDRIGLCGSSGGGTQSAYIAAVDERVLAAAPANFITSYRRLLETRGPQDPEQYLHRQIAAGLDHADYLLARAPRPTLVQATSRDFFNIHGARETVAEAARAFAALGAAGNLALNEDDFEHGYTRATREALYAFFQTTLNVPGSPAEEVIAFPPAADLRVTASGQVATSLGGESFFSLTRRAAEDCATRLEASRRDLAAHLPRVRAAARELSGYVAPPAAIAPVLAGRYRRDGYAVEKFLALGEGGYALPFLLFVPDGAARRPAAIYLHAKGKAAEAAPGGEFERLARAGHVVLAPDLAGIGELAPADDAWEMTMLLGRSLAGLRAGDIARLARFLGTRPEVDAQRIAGIARGETGAELLHAAAFEPALARVALFGSLASYRALATEDHHAPRYHDQIVARALTAYDLPDLAAALAPRPLAILAPRDGSAAQAGPDLIQRDFAVVASAYADAPGRFLLRPEFPDRDAFEALLGWLR